MNKVPISVIILTYNEELNFEHCLKSVAGWAGEIIIIDSFSTDKTLEIAKKYGAQVHQHEFKNQADQFNWALDSVEIKNNWILRLDADERLTEELKKEIAEKLPNIPKEVAGFYIKRRVYFMGRWIKYGGYYPTWILRLFRKGEARSEEREMDEHIVLLDGKAEKLKNDFIDENHQNLEQWTAKHNRYSGREASERLKREVNPHTKNLVGGQAGRKRWIKQNIYIKLPLFCRAFAYFIYRYIFRLGFLDGREGLIFHFLQGCWHQFLIDAKIYEQIYEKNKK